MQMQSLLTLIYLIVDILGNNLLRRKLKDQNHFCFCMFNIRLLVAAILALRLGHKPGFVERWKKNHVYLKIQSIKNIVEQNRTRRGLIQVLILSYANKLQASY